MANLLYPLGKEGLLAGEIDLDTATIKVALVRGYTYSAAHKFMGDLTGAGGGTVAASVALASKSVTGGAFDAADATFAAVAAGAACDTLVIYQSSAVGGGSDVAASAQRLIARLDAVTGLPVTPNGGDIALTFDNGPSKIFAI